MGQKVHPKGFRLGINTQWTSRWLGRKDQLASQLKEDVQVREFIQKRWKRAGIASVEIERSTGFIRLLIRTSRPGILIGRGGSGIEEMTKILKQRFFRNKKQELKLDIQEVRHFEEDASLLAQNVAEQLERRVAFRRAMKAALDQAEKNKNILGVKIEVSGRLGGAEMSRREWLSRGKIPLHTLRAKIDYAQAIASTTYGVIGVKAWIYKK